LEETFNNPQNRESSHFDFYDDFLTIHGFPQNLPTNKEGFKQFIYLLWKAFPDIRIMFEDIIIEGNKVVFRYLQEQFQLKGELTSWKGKKKMKARQYQ